MAEIRSINALRADKAGDNTLLTPAEMLDDAAADLRAGKKRATKAIVILLDTGDDGDSYNVGVYSSNIRCSEMLGLAEFAKTIFLAWMREER